MVKRALVFSLLLLVAVESSADQSSVSSIFKKIRKNYEIIQDYQCRIDTFCTDGKRFEHRILNFYFKRPRYIRIDVLWGNMPFDCGSIGVFKGGETITGHRGGLLRSITMQVHKKSPFATTLRGEAFDEIDMEAVLSRLFFYLEHGECQVAEDEHSFIIVCVPYVEEENEGISKDVAWFDKESLIITKFQRYESDKLVQEAVWKDYIINVDLPDMLFDLQFDPQELKKRDIPILPQRLK